METIHIELEIPKNLLLLNRCKDTFTFTKANES